MNKGNIHLSFQKVYMQINKEENYMRNEIRKPRVINRNGKSTLILEDTPERKNHKISIELDKKEVEKIIIHVR